MAEDTKKSPLRPEARITVSIKGQPTTLLMTAARRALCATYIADVEAVAGFYIDSVTQQAVLTELLRERDKYGHPVVEKDEEGKEIYPAYETFELDIEDHEKLVDWVGRHVNAFFINGLLAYATTAEAQQEAALEKTNQNSAPSTTGSSVSPTTKQSAGDSTAA